MSRPDKTKRQIFEDLQAKMKELLDMKSEIFDKNLDDKDDLLTQITMAINSIAKELPLAELNMLKEQRALQGAKFDDLTKQIGQKNAELRKNPQDENLLSQVTKSKEEIEKMIFEDRALLSQIAVLEKSLEIAPVAAAISFPSAAASAAVNFPPSSRLAPLAPVAQKLTALYEINSQDVKDVLCFLCNNEEGFSISLPKKTYIVKKEGEDYFVKVRDDKKERNKFCVEGDELKYFEKDKIVKVGEGELLKIKDILNLIVNARVPIISRGKEKISLDDLVNDSRKKRGAEEQVMYL